MNTTSLALIHYAGWLTCDKGKDENSWSDRKHLPKGKITALQFINITAPCSRDPQEYQTVSRDPTEVLYDQKKDFQILK